MFRYTEDKRHCFVYRQPETAEDLEKMLEVLKFQELGCIRCRTRDRDLLQQIKKRDLQQVCDEF